MFWCRLYIFGDSAVYLFLLFYYKRLQAYTRDDLKNQVAYRLFIFQWTI